jgi:hypothetical protein
MNPFGIDPLSPPPVEVPMRLYPRQTAWSYSAVSAHAKCPQQFRFRRIDRLPEPTSEAMARGSDKHAHVAHYLTTGELPERVEVDEYAEWFPLFNRLRDAGATPEQQVAFTRKWERTGWYGQDVFLRVVFDAIALGDGRVSVYEWKTGKRYDEHLKQMRLYCLAALKLYPEVEEAECVIGYLDQGPALTPNLVCKRTVEKDLETEFAEFSRHFLADDIYPATPGIHCRWCHFRKGNNGPCAHG